MNSEKYFIKDHEQFDLSIVKNDPLSIDFEDFNGDSSGRLDVKFPSVTLECFFKKSNIKRIFVFLSAAGRKTPTTKFNRIRWCSQMNSNLLYIEDPMYKKHNGLRCGWYYGTEKISYLKYIISLVEKFASIEGVENENIVFVGASSAGYAALFLANEIKGSVAYAYNPQILLPAWHGAKNFQEKTGINLEINDPYGRCDIKRIIDNNTSNFIIYYNPASKLDSPQVGSWLKELGVKSSGGYATRGNVHFLIQEVKNNNTHNCSADINDFIFSLNVIKYPPLDRYEIVDSYLNRFKSYVIKDEESFHSKLWFEYVIKKIPEIFYIPESISGSTLHLRVKYSGDFLKYRLHHTRSTKRSEIAVYIKKDEFSSSEGFVRFVNDLAGKYEFGFLNDAKGVIKVSKAFSGSSDFIDNLEDFILKIHLKIYFQYFIAKLKKDPQHGDEDLIEHHKFMCHFQSWAEGKDSSPES